MQVHVRLGYAGLERRSVRKLAGRVAVGFVKPEERLAAAESGRRPDEDEERPAVESEERPVAAAQPGRRPVERDEQPAVVSEERPVAAA